MGVEAWIYTGPGDSDFVIESSASFQQIEDETKCLPDLFWQGFKIFQHATVNLHDSSQG